MIRDMILSVFMSSVTVIKGYLIPLEILNGPFLRGRGSTPSSTTPTSTTCSDTTQARKQDVKHALKQDKYSGAEWVCRSTCEITYINAHSKPLKMYTVEQKDCTIHY